jgi:SAM-dependent methyltransferase
MQEYSDRHQTELEFHSNIIKRQKESIVDESMIPWNFREYVSVLSFYCSGDELAGKYILDCGCGYGFMTVLLALKGAYVKAFDISPERVEAADRLSRVNGVEDSVEIAVMAIEHLDYSDESFDLVLGTRVLHHVDIKGAAPNIFRVLKQGGHAIFWEPTHKNPLMAILRKVYRRIPGIPIKGSLNEHPLTRQEIDLLSETFNGDIRLHPAPFVFFSHFAQITRLTKVKLIQIVVQRLDYLIDRIFPFLRRWSYHQILVLAK